MEMLKRAYLRIALEAELARTVEKIPKWPVGSGPVAELGKEEEEEEQAWCDQKNLWKKVGVLGQQLLP